MVTRRNRGQLLLSIIASGIILFFTSCGNKHKPARELDTPTSGEITIVADETFSSLIKDEATTFSNIYPNAKIKVMFLPESEAVKTFFSDSNMRLMFIPRRLYADERKYFETIGIPSREVKIAIDAVALIINSQNPDTMLRYDQVQSIFSGEISSWKQINQNSSLDTLLVVFDNRNSSTIRYVSESILEGKPLSANAFAVDSNLAVINYVKENPSAIGVLGSGWITNPGDTSEQSFLKDVKVVAVSSRNSTDKFYLPQKRYIYSLKYPFLRELFILSQEKHTGLGTGFATYVASDEGQRIVQRIGLLPVDNALRIIELKNEF